MENSLRADPLALIAVLLIAAPALAQPPLAEVARKEAARRASIGEKSRFYTNDDLAGGSRLTTGAASRPDPEAPVAGPDAPPAAPGGAADGAPGAERNEAYWRGRITAARDAKQRADLVAAALQNRVDGLLSELTARDDPAQRAQLERDRADALSELEATRTDVERLGEEIAAIRGSPPRGRPAGVAALSPGDSRPCRAPAVIPFVGAAELLQREPAALTILTRCTTTALPVEVPLAASDVGRLGQPQRASDGAVQVTSG